MVKLDIDGQSLDANSGDMIIEVADKAGTYIPRFCYHQKLSIAANCRMCLVEVEGVGKAVPACATPVADGMKVLTRSPKALEAQRHVMEFLLVNHPLDCPVCDQGGQCELQDLSMGYGDGISQYNQGKRSVQDKNIGPLIDTNMTRCIHCTRCVRFGTEIAGVRELGLTGRGEQTQVGTYVAKLVNSEVAGNVIDLCPVGALNAKPNAKQGRAWHLIQHAGAAMHDCLASPVYWHADRDDRGQSHIVQVVPKMGDGGEHCWISDRDRFSYTGLAHKERLKSPMIKKKGVWCEVSWQEAITQLSAIAEGIQREDGHGDNLAVLASPSESMESLYMLQKLWRSLGSSNIDYRWRRWDFSDQSSDSLLPGLGFDPESLGEKHAIWLVDCDLPRECPVLNIHARQATLKGAKVMTTASASYDYPMDIAVEQHPKNGLVDALLAVLQACLSETKIKADTTWAEHLKGIQFTEESEEIAKQMCSQEDATILLGLKPQSRHDFANIYAVLAKIAEVSGATLGALSHGANAAGAAAIGFLPHRGIGGQAVEAVGQDARSIWNSPKKLLGLFNVEPELDTPYGAAMLEGMKSAHWVVAFTSYANDTMKKFADVMLPIAAMGESAGTLMDGNGKLHSFAAAADLPGFARPAWKVFRALGSSLSLVGFAQMTLQDVRDAMHAELDKAAPVTPTTPAMTSENGGDHMQVYWPIYLTDSVVRRAEPLQQALPASAKRVQVGSDVATEHELQSGDTVIVQQGEHHATLTVWVDEKMSAKGICLPMGHTETRGFDLGDIQLHKGEAHV